MFLSYDKAYRWPVHFAMLLPLLLLVLLTGSIYSFWGVEVRVPMAMHRLAYPGITALMDFFTDWGDKSLYAVYALLLAAACIRNDRPEILFYIRYALVALLFALLVTQLLKASFGMPRPDYSLPRDPFSFTNAYSSFPSGHTVSIIIAAMPLAFRIGKTWAFIAASLVIALVGYSRVWLGVHHPVDILAGMIVGSIGVWVVFRFRRPSRAAASSTE